MREFNFKDLYTEYKEALSVDQAQFSEMRSNILLHAGDHYNRSKTWERLRGKQDLTAEQRIRVTKNHLGTILDGKINLIEAYVSSVVSMPVNPRDDHDHKAAELTQSVIKFGARENDWERLKSVLAKDYVTTGEVIAKVYYDTSKGPLLGYEPKLGEDGEPLLDEQGFPVEGAPVFRGKLCVDTLYAFNTFYDPAAKNWGEARYMGYQHMMDTKDVKARYPDNAALVQDSSDQTFTVFGLSNGTAAYSKAKGKTLVLEWYIKPCIAYPEGYYYIGVEGGELQSGPIPAGEYPIVHESYEEFATLRRGVSLAKKLRPFQVEINRLASKMAELQQSFDTKLAVHSGTKLSTGGFLPGARYYTYTGKEPTVIPGDTGAQYLVVFQAAVEEMYQVAEHFSDSQDEKGATDGYGMVYRSLKAKKRNISKIKRFMGFCERLWSVYVKLAQHYFDEQYFIPVFGKSELVNVEEFKGVSELQYHVQLEAQSDDVDTLMARQLSITQTLQYTSSQLDKNQIGQLIRGLPFGNGEKVASDLTVDTDAAENTILSLDRGETPVFHAYVDASYMIRRITLRMSKSDYSFLDPKIKELYDGVKDAYEKKIADDAYEALLVAKGAIPTGGGMVKANIYMPDADNPSKMSLAAYPQESLEWLSKALEAQGLSMSLLRNLGSGSAAKEVAEQIPGNEAQGMGDVNPQQSL